MFCPHCGKENDNNVRFCANCGKMIESKNNYANSGNVSTKSPKPPKASKDPFKMKKYFFKSLVSSLIVFIVCFAISLGSFAYYIAVPSIALEDKALTPPKQPKISDPVYDTNSIVKNAVADVDLGEPATEDELKQFNKDLNYVEKAIDKGEAVAKKSNPKITEDNRNEYIDAVEKRLALLYDKDLIKDYDTHSDESITITFNSGIGYVYSPEIDGFDAGTDTNMKVASFQPSVSGYSKLDKFMKYPDTSAKLITDTFSMYSFDGDVDDYNDEEVDITSLVSTANYNVILWHGHGGYSNDFGPFMATGIKNNNENKKKYYNFLSENSMLFSKNSLLVTSKFFEQYIPDGAYDNSVIYLGTCSSGYSDDLAETFIEKGAEAVYANSGIIHTTYNLSMMKSVVDALCSTNSDDFYNNVSDALTIAKDANGEYDFGDEHTYVKLYTENSGFALDWYEDHMISEREVVLVLDRSGSMDGKPLEETKKAALKFVDTVVEAKATISIVEYSSEAEIKVDFTNRKKNLYNIINNMDAYGGTNISDGLEEAEGLLKDSDAKKKIIILMSDGEPNYGLEGQDLIDYAETIRSKGINIYALGFFHKSSGSDKVNNQNLMSQIADEGCYHDVSDADDISYVFDDVATEISGQRRIYIRIACPVDVEITCDGETLSKDNTRTSFGSISFEAVENNDSTSYSDDDDDGSISETVKTVRLVEGLDYDIQIEGTDDGEMDYTVGFMDENSEYTDLREFEDINITEDTEIKTKAVYSNTSTLTVDEDGDGKIDLVYRAEKDSTANVKEVKIDWRILVTAISGGMAVLALIVYIVSFKFYKKYKLIVNTAK